VWSKNDHRGNGVEVTKELLEIHDMHSNQQETAVCMERWPPKKRYKKGSAQWRETSVAESSVFLEQELHWMGPEKREQP